MKIAFISANRELLPDPVVPLGLLTIMANTPSKHEKALLDLCFVDDPLLNLKNFLIQHKPDVIALGLRNLQNNHYAKVHHNLDYYSSLMNTLRNNSNAPIVVGGGGFSVAPIELMNHLNPDFGIIGEGEHSFPLLLETIESGRPGVEMVPNLCFFRDGKLEKTMVPVPSIDLPNAPFVPRLNVNSQYYDGGIESIQTKRGCALNCDYCTYPIIEGRNYRLKDPCQVLDEMECLQEINPKIQHFFIVDSVFNIPISHAKDVCREMIRRGFRTPWTCYANPLAFDEELAELMAAAHCEGVEVGSDSGVDRVLRKLKKGFKTDRIQKLHALCTQYGIKDCHTFILGTQGETLDEVAQTIEFVDDMNPFASIFMVWSDDFDIFSEKATRERCAFRKDVLGVLKEKLTSHPKWIVPELGINFDPIFFRYLRHNGMGGPLWQHINKAPAKPVYRRPRTAVL